MEEKMGLPIFFILFSAIIILIIADCSRKINLACFIPMGIYVLIAPNIILTGYIIYKEEALNMPVMWKIMNLIIMGIFIFYMWIRLNIFPVLDGKKASVRLKIMIGGRVITYYGLLSIVMQGIIFAVVYPRYKYNTAPLGMLYASAIYAVCSVLFILANGVLRIFFTSRRLAVKRRVIMLLCAWVPIVNLIILLYACRLISEEYNFECEKVQLRNLRVDSDLCKTKYPLVLYMV
jgi:triacylglycerol lipase